MDENVRIYTDGSKEENQDTAGWGLVVIEKGKVIARCADQ